MSSGWPKRPSGVLPIRKSAILLADSALPSVATARSLRRSPYLRGFAGPNAIKHLKLSGLIGSLSSLPIWITSRFLTPVTSRITNNPNMPLTK